MTCLAGPAAVTAAPRPIAPREITPPATAPPHEIPTDVVVRAFVKAEDGALRLVVRVPLTSMRDVDFPVRGPGYVEIEEASALLDDQAALWIAGYVALYEESARLPTPLVEATRISLPSDPSFADYDRALAHVSAAPLRPGIDLVLEQAMLDVVLVTPIQSETARFSIDPAWAHLGIRTTTVLRFVTPAGAERVYQYQGNPGRVRLDPRWHQALWRFVVLGFAHILDGIDHLLFLLCLVLPLAGAAGTTPSASGATRWMGGVTRWMGGVTRWMGGVTRWMGGVTRWMGGSARLWAVVAVVTAFTAAHSITLGASVLGLAPNALWFPPLIEMLIAASIVFMAVENIVARTQRRRWMWAFGFGLVHGFGFSFQLRESLQFAGSHLFTSLLGFNVGVELGQIVALLAMVPALALLFAKVASARVGAIVVSALVAHASWHWMAERWGVLRAYAFQRPALDAMFGAAALRWAALLLVVAAAGWGLAALYRRVAEWVGPGEDADAE